MDQRDQRQRRSSAVDRINNAVGTARKIQNAYKLARAAGTAAEVVSTSEIWVPIAIVAAVILIIVFIILLGGGTGAAQELGAQPTPGGQYKKTCDGASLDYYIPFRDPGITSVPLETVKNAILALGPNAQLQNWDTIVWRSVANGWNPALVLTLWIEESGAQGVIGYTDPLGCDPKHPTTDINTSLSCLFNSFGGYTSFEDFMCLYGGDGFHKAPCTFKVENPNFPGGIKDVYSKLVPGGVMNLPAGSCGPSVPGDWPTTGLLTQGPEGALDHARIKSESGAESLDIANPAGPPVYSSFDGIASVHDCIIFGDCGIHYGNSVEIKSNGFSVMYGHLSLINVSDGQTVKAGDQIGIMGTTGYSTGIHLHWEFRGILMQPPNIPKAIAPLNCNTPIIECAPASIP